MHHKPLSALIAAIIASAASGRSTWPAVHAPGHGKSTAAWAAGQPHLHSSRSSPALVPQNAQAGGPLQGALFWTWYAEGQQAPAEEQGGASGLFGERHIRCRPSRARSCTRTAIGQHCLPAR